jgi:hypothetical protein
MKEDQSEGTTRASLLGLYLERKENLFASLDKQSPDDAANKVSSFIRDLERPYTDKIATSDVPVYLIHHVLNTVAGASQTLVAVNATTSSLKPGKVSGGGSKGLAKFTGSVRSRPIFFLWTVAVACILAVVLILTNDPEPAILPVVMFIVIAILAAVGATSSGSESAKVLTPKVNLYVDGAMLDKKISHALRVADELLAAASLAHEPEEEKSDHPELEPKRTFELLQALASHRITSHPEKEANDLAGDAIRILFNAKITPVEYSREQSHLFEERPAGVKKYHTLLPALVDEQGELVREGVVLVPIT